MIPYYRDITREYQQLLISGDTELYHANSFCFFTTVFHLVPWGLAMGAVFILVTGFIQIPFDLLFVLMSTFVSCWSYTHVSYHEHTEQTKNSEQQEPVEIQ
jgi:membrane protein implicated in regulation of membrane protease activity